MLFVVGMKVVVQDELDYRTGLVVGVSFWAGVGFQNGVIFPEYFADFAGGLLQNGMTAGGLVAILMTLFVELTAPRPSRIEVEFGMEALPKIREFLASFASRGGWGKAMTDRLDAAGEETLLTLMRQDEEGEATGRRRLRLTARKQGGGALLEFVAAAGAENIQDRIALLGTGPVEAPDEREISLRPSGTIAWPLAGLCNRFLGTGRRRVKEGWWRWLDLNQRQRGYEPRALTN